MSKLGGTFIQLNAEIAETIAKTCKSTKYFSEEVALAIERNRVSSLDMDTWQEELTMVISKLKWGIFDKNDLGYQTMFGGEK